MNQKIKDTYKGNFILHVAMVAGVIIFAVIAHLVNNMGTEPLLGHMEDMSKTFQYIAYALTIGGYLGGMYMFNNLVKQARQKEGLLSKLEAYRSANVMQIALLEGPALVSIVFYLLTNAYVFLLIGGMLILYMLLKLPVVSKISEDLELSNEERKVLSEAVAG